MFDPYAILNPQAHSPSPNATNTQSSNQNHSSSLHHTKSHKSPSSTNPLTEKLKRLSIKYSSRTEPAPSHKSHLHHTKSPPQKPKSKSSNSTTNKSKSRKIANKSSKKSSDAKNISSLATKQPEKNSKSAPPKSSTSTRKKKKSLKKPKKKKNPFRKSLAGHSTNSCHWRRPNLLHMRLTHHQVDEKALTKWLLQARKVILSKKNPPRAVKAIIELQENQLNDNAIKLLCTFIFQNHLQVSVLKLWKNNIGDEGALAIAKLVRIMPMQEVHLSHNRITTHGAKAIFDSIAANKHYPIIISKRRKAAAESHSDEDDALHPVVDIPSDRFPLSEANGEDLLNEHSNLSDRSTILDTYNISTMPLWLRLEYNRIDAQDALEYLTELGLSWCNAENRNLCGPFNCAKRNIPHVHLYCFEYQYQSPDMAPLLLETQSTANQMRLSLEAKLMEEQQRDGRISSPHEEAQIREEYSLSISKEISKQLPLYIFLDSCSILNMMGSSNASHKKFHLAHRFSFKNLLRKARLKQFGDFPDSSDRIHLILTDTIMQELDHLKNHDTQGFSYMIRSMTRDGGLFQKASKLNFLTMLGAHEAELLVKSKGKEFFGQDGRPLVSNDLKLLQVALFWQEAISVSGSVMVLTDDWEVHRRAKQHGLPCELLSVLDEKLEGLENDVWTPQMIRQLIPEAFQNHRGENLLEKKPMKTSFNSIYDEMDSAISLVQRWMKMAAQGGFILRGASDGVKMVEEAEASTTQNCMAGTIAAADWMAGRSGEKAQSNDSPLGDELKNGWVSGIDASLKEKIKRDIMLVAPSEESGSSICESESKQREEIVEADHSGASENSNTQQHENEQQVEQEDQMTPFERLVLDSEDSLKRWKDLMSMRPSLLK